MMQAAFEGKSVWKAGALSLLSSAASYGIGAAFGGVSGLGNELLRAGAHGLASGLVSALDGGNFASAFVSGAAASGIGSFAQGVNMNPALMIASTTVMGGLAAWATGGDFLQGAMQGMTIGLFNHAAHNDGNVIGGNSICERLPDGTYVASADLKEVIVYGHRKLAYTPKHPIEKPLREIHPEFDILMLGRAFFQGAIQAIRAEGKSVSDYIKSETGGVNSWVRTHDSYSYRGGFDTRSTTWGSNNYYRQKIGNSYLRKLNGKLRNSRIPINSWRTADKGHFHWKWGFRDTDEWHWFRR